MPSRPDIDEERLVIYQTLAEADQARLLAEQANNEAVRQFTETSQTLMATMARIDEVQARLRQIHQTTRRRRRK